jgi:prepilin-type N-terminal cleavage/methylation domain-containing protein
MKKGFTIVELLIVIIVIAILATITIVAYNGVQQRSRESKRAADMKSLQKAIMTYDTANSGVPLATTFSGAGPGGWNNSTMASWITFLQSSYNGALPKDPTNVTSGDPTQSGNYAYFYYCYAAGSGPAQFQPQPNVTIGYKSEPSGSNVYTRFTVQNCT